MKPLCSKAYERHSDRIGMTLRKRGLKMTPEGIHPSVRQSEKKGEAVKAIADRFHCLPFL